MMVVVVVCVCVCVWIIVLHLEELSENEVQVYKLEVVESTAEWIILKELHKGFQLVGANKNFILFFT